MKLRWRSAAKGGRMIESEGVEGFQHGATGAGEALSLAPRTDLFEDDALRSIQARALTYLLSGVPVHLRGPAGVGKTTLALQVAARLGRPAVLVTGDGWFRAQDLVGGQSGVRTRQVRDRYIHTVQKSETETKAIWEDSVLTTAVSKGFTLVYDEFTRSPPAANNPLLAALEERVLVLAGSGREQSYVPAHPDFRAIFTSNPEEYAGVNAPQDALIDRMVTFDLSGYSAETEIGIVARRSGLDAARCAPIVSLVRAVREGGGAGQPPSMRAAIMIARVAASQDLAPAANDDGFVQLCFDVLESRAPPLAQTEARTRFFERLRLQILTHCPPRALREWAA